LPTFSRARPRQPVAGASLHLIAAVFPLIPEFLAE
jgi:hypothetical protein